MSDQAARVLPEAAIDALDGGDLIGAIGIVRDELQLSLREAKALIDQHIEARSRPQPEIVTGHGIPLSVYEAVLHDEPVDAIRRLRDAAGLSLRDAKRVVDAIRAGESIDLATLPRAKPASGASRAGSVFAEAVLALVAVIVAVVIGCLLIR